MPNRFVFGNENGAASASASSGGGPTMMYEFKDTTAPLQDHPSRRGHARNRGGGSQGSHSSTYGGSGGGGDDDGTAGSLSYSVASSVTGESTDSSFAEIMRVLESSDNDNNASSKELSHHLKKQQLQQAQHQNITTEQSLSQHRFAFGGDEKSVAADSLAYSAKSSSVASENSLAYSIDAAETYMRSLAADGEASHLSHLQGSALVSAG